MRQLWLAARRMCNNSHWNKPLKLVGKKSQVHRMADDG